MLPEILRIITENSGSLAVLNDFESDEYQNYIGFFRIEEESAFGAEPFPGAVTLRLHESKTVHLLYFL